MGQQTQAFAIAAPGFYGLNKQDSSLDLSTNYALTATNAVIDKFGRIGARKGWVKVNSSAVTGDVKTIGELISNSGASYILCAAGAKLFKLDGSSLTELTYGGGGTAPTITDANWQIATLNGIAYFYQRGYDPLIFDPAVSSTTFRRVSEKSGALGTPQQGNCVISAYGRVWSADTSTDKNTVAFSDLQSGHVWTTGTSGTLDVSEVWPAGADEITALGAFNNFLIIFGRRQILIYSGASDPTAMTLNDAIVGYGCIARDSVANTGTDLLFLSDSGVRSLLRTIQEKSNPLREASKNVRDELMTYLNSETVENIKAVYSGIEAFYLLNLPFAGITYCFDTRQALQDGSARVTSWDNINPTAMFAAKNRTLYLGKTGYLARYAGYNDNTATYRFEYYTTYVDLGSPTVTSILKRIQVACVGGSGLDLAIKWDFDYLAAYRSETKVIQDQSIAEYGLGEYGLSQYSSGIVLDILTAQASGTGKVVQLGFEAEINGTQLSIQKVDILAKQGKIV
jgi:hypothetical protein